MSRIVSKSSSKNGYMIKNGKIYYVYKNINRRRNVEGLEKLEVRILMHKKKKIMNVVSLALVMILITLVAAGLFYLCKMIYPPVDMEPVHVEVNDIQNLDLTMKVETFYGSAYNSVESSNSVNERKELVQDQNVYSGYKGGEIEIHTLEYKETRDMYEVVDCMSSTTNGTTGEIIHLDNATLVEMELPSKYYGNIDFSSFQPYMSYYKVTNKTSPAYSVCHSENAYTDENGLRRYRTTADQFTIDGQDDYMIALGTFYKEKGTAGSRYLIETTTGAYTAITGSEKADDDTDKLNMFRSHGNKAGMIEWIVDERCLNNDISAAGTVTNGPVEALKGEIISIYKIE